MNLIRDYDNFFLPAGNLDIAKEFYGEKLGLRLHFDFSDQGMAAFGVGNQEPAIILSDLPGVKPAIWFVVDDVVKACSELRSRGVRFLSEPFRIPTGLAVEFSDPFGNRLGITDYSHSSQPAPGANNR